MPELPEVEVVRAGLAPAVTGATVTRVTVFDERSLRRHPGPAEDFVARVTGSTLRAPSRRGKFLWIPLAPPSLPSTTSEMTSSFSEMTEIAGGRDPGLGGVEHPDARTPSFRKVPGADEAPAGRAGADEALVVHLGMSGQVLLRDQQADDARTRIRIDLRHPHLGELRLNFVDQRIFGSMAIDDLVAAADIPAQRIPRAVAHIARDPLDPDFDDRAFFARLSRRNSGIKRAILDQTLISGVGNIYADESLWAARIHYEQLASDLSRAKAKSLLASIRDVLAEALAAGGTSFDTQYLNVNGESGYFSRSLNVYGQQGEPCQRCGRPIVRERFMNRSSHLCPHCQRVR